MKYWEIIANRLMKAVEAWAGSQPLIPKGERSGLLTLIAARESASFVGADDKLTAFLELQAAIRAWAELS